ESEPVLEPPPSLIHTTGSAPVTAATRRAAGSGWGPDRAGPRVAATRARRRTGAVPAPRPPATRPPRARGSRPGLRKRPTRAAEAPRRATRARREPPA